MRGADASPDREEALVDLDGTLADYEGGMRSALSLLASPGEPELTEDIWKDPPDWLDARMSLVKKTPGFWRDLTPISDGFGVLAMIVAEMDTSILTKGPRKTHSAWSEKVEWCARYVPDLPVTVGYDKGKVYGRLLFDDFPDYALKWLAHRPRGVVLMLEAPINAGFEHPQVYRVPRPFGPEAVEVVTRAISVAKRR